MSAASAAVVASATDADDDAEADDDVDVRGAQRRARPPRARAHPPTVDVVARAPVVARIPATAVRPRITSRRTVTRAQHHLRRRFTRARDARRATRAPSTAMDVVIVKLGGAALTVKSRRGTIDARGFADCVETVARAHATGATRLIVAHGAGSFGHGA